MDTQLPTAHRFIEVTVKTIDTSSSYLNYIHWRNLKILAIYDLLCANSEGNKFASSCGVITRLPTKELSRQKLRFLFRFIFCMNLIQSAQAANLCSQVFNKDNFTAY